MVFPFSRSGLKSSGIRYITIGLRRGRVGISVHFAGLFVVVAVGRYKTDVFCFSYFTHIGPEPHNSYSVIFGMLACVRWQSGEFGCGDRRVGDLSFYRVFGLLPISIYDLQKFSRDMSWGFVPGTPSGIGWSIAAKWSIQNCGNRPSAVRKFIGRAVKRCSFLEPVR